MKPTQQEVNAVMAQLEETISHEITPGQLLELARFAGLEPNFGEELAPVDRLCISRQVARTQERNVGPWREPIITERSEQIRIFEAQAHELPRGTVKHVNKLIRRERKQLPTWLVIGGAILGAWGVVALVAWGCVKIGEWMVGL